jgi:NADP-dependent 3-hydroxy acid dehydrogenase YdfG/SAM-dependent methyltransferase
LTVHAKGGIKLGVIHKTVKQVIPVNTIKDRLKRKVEEKFIYERFKRVGLDYGTYFKGLKEMWFSDNDAIGRIEIASGYEHEMDTFKLHPNLMDAALQIIAMMKLGRKDASARPVMPFTVDCVEYLYPLKTRGFAYVKSDGEERYNVAVTDDNGNVCVKLMGVVVREAKDSMNNFFYRPVWVKEPLDETGNISAGGSNYKKRVLIIYTAVSEKLKQAISKLHVNDELVEIGLGSRKESLSCKEMWINTSSQPELKECIEKQGNIDRIYFLAGLTGLNNMEHSIEVLEENQENGVISLFRLVKALGDLGYSNKPIELKVVTDSAVKVFPEDKINPYPASIFGFCMSMAKEYRSWKVSCIDIDLNSQSTVPFTDSFNDTAKRVVDESPKISGNIAAIRSGKRYVRKLVPIKLPSQQSVPFKQNGVYLILGGAGGIGSELGKYLAENFKANLVLVGRSAFDPAKENLIKDIKAVGGDAIYVEADATNLESMRTVVKNAKRSFGRINGVVHAAIVLKDGIIEMMDEADFRQVMAPKVRGSFILQEVVKEEDIDFMMFFSSTQSFSGHIGQSNYAAACTFKDAYAEYLSGKGGYEVKIVNWGFWGSVGVVATEEYNRRLASQGLYSISPVEGIEAVNRILGGRTVQVAAIKADERYLKSMGVLFDRSIEQYPEIIPATTKMIPGSIEDGLSMDNSTKTAFRELEETLRLLLLDAFRKEGMFLKSGVEYNIKDSAVQLGILPEYNRLFEAMLDILEKSGFIHLRGDWMLTGGSVESEELLAGLNSLASKKAALFEKYEEIRPHLKLISACFEEYFNILRGKVRATDVIFPESSLKLVEGIYISDIVSKYCSNIVAGVLENYIGRRILDLKEGEKINILEVGAGTGSTSKIVFEHLKKYGDKIKYIYSDVSLRFTRFGNSEFGSKYPFTEFRTLDVERDAEEQGYAAGSIDVVLGSNVLHATRNLGKTLGNIKHLLKTNGWLVINEVTQAKEFLTLTFGLLEGWWVYEDDIRLKHSPLLSLEGWENLLKESGFKGTAYSGHASKDGAELSQHVIVAESDGIVFRNVRNIKR